MKFNQDVNIFDEYFWQNWALPFLSDGDERKSNFPDLATFETFLQKKKWNPNLIINPFMHE